MKLDCNENIYYVLKSLFRFSQLKELKAPEILFENERKLLKKHMANLNADEIHYMVLSWGDFCAEQTILDKQQNNELDRDLKEYYKTVN